MSVVPNFDLLARPYRWLEYATFAFALERCRNFRLEAMRTTRCALVYGDGDGRFLERLLTTNAGVRVDSVDASAAMLRLQQGRVSQLRAELLVTLHHADVRGWAPPSDDYDLVVSHFFLDCFTEGEIEGLLDRVCPKLAHGAQWVISEFARPHGRAAGWAGGSLVSGLYAAFGALTGLQVRKLPAYRQLLEARGFTRTASREWLGGLMVSELWRLARRRDRQPR